MHGRGQMVPKELRIHNKGFRSRTAEFPEKEVRRIFLDWEIAA
jgi:hypothetical protein